MFMCDYVCLFVCLRILHLPRFVCTFLYVYTYMTLCVCVYTYKCVYVYMCILWSVQNTCIAMASASREEEPIALSLSTERHNAISIIVWYLY